MNAPLRNSGFDPRALRAEFPIFANNPGMVFLDTAASSQKPAAVIDGVADYYRTDYANVHRGIYRLSARSTERFEAARTRVRRFINAADDSEIVFVRGATEALNLVAHCWGGTHLQAGDQVVISALEHHANIVPWQFLRDRIGIEIVVVPLDAGGGFDMEAFTALLNPRVKLVSVTHVANVTGHIVPVERVVELAHGCGAKVLLDGCQALPRIPIDVQKLNCDFYVFSGHKLYGPTGIGGLYGRRALLDAMPPWQGGGDMIDVVTFEHSTFQEPPHRFEAGTPDISGAIGLDIALSFIEGLGREAIFEHEIALTDMARQRLAALPGVRVLGNSGQHIGVVSFDVEGVHPFDLSTILDHQNVAVRAGHHCAQPLMGRLGVTATTRASFGVYSDEADVEALVTAVQKAQRVFGIG